MKKFSVIFKQLYLEKIKSKSFITITAIFLLVIVGMNVLPGIMEDLTKEDITIKVVNQSSIDELPPITDINKDITLSETTDQEKKLKKEIEDGKINGYLVIKNLSEKQISGEYVSTSLSNMGVNTSLENYLQSINQGLLLLAADLSPSELEQMAINEGPLELVNLNESDGISSSDSAHVLVTAFVFFIFLFIQLYMTMIATEISKEKDSRILEVIVSSTNPIEHFLGKLLAVIAVAFTQVAIIVTGLILTLNFSKTAFVQNVIKEQLDVIPASLFAYMGVFIVLALTGYSIVAALLGSLTSKVEEINQYMMPLLIVFIIGFSTAFGALSNPDLLMVRIMSYIPLLSPLIMFVRIALTSVPVWEIATSIILQLLFNIFVIVVTIHFYRGTVLTYSTKGSFIQSFKQAWSLAKQDSK